MTDYGAKLIANAIRFLGLCILAAAAASKYTITDGMGIFRHAVEKYRED